jgi:hypothetical protein
MGNTPFGEDVHAHGHDGTNWTPLKLLGDLVKVMATPYTYQIAEGNVQDTLHGLRLDTMELYLQPNWICVPMRRLPQVLGGHTPFQREH